MTCFEDILKSHAKSHPSIRPVDMIKLCYQAAFGAEHLLIDRDRAKQYFDWEYEATSPSDEPLFEEISEDYCRANIGASKAQKIPAEDLFEAFFRTASEKSGLSDSFEARLDTVGALSKNGSLPFSYEEWKNALSEYKALGGGPVHHSEEYRQAAHPAYRVIAKKYINALIKEKDND